MEISQNIIDPKLYIPFSEYVDTGNNSKILRPFQLSKYKRVNNHKMLNTKSEDSYYIKRMVMMRKSSKSEEKWDRGNSSGNEKKPRNFKFSKN